MRTLRKHKIFANIRGMNVTFECSLKFKKYLELDDGTGSAKTQHFPVFWGKNTSSSQDSITLNPGF